MKKVIGIVIGAVALIGAAPLILQRVVGVYFMPSAEWVGGTAWPGSIAGMALGVVAAVFILRTRADNPQLAQAGWFRLGFTTITVGLLMWMCGFLTATLSLPMAHAALVHSDIRLPYTVADPDDSGSRGCRPAIEVAGLPFLLNQLCGPPPQLSAALRPGNTVYAVGRGSQVGVFYNAFSLGR